MEASQTAPLEPVVIDVIGCARCHGEGHPQLEFKPLTYPVAIPYSDIEFVMWAPCPTNGEPIMMTYVAKDATDG